MNLAEIFNLDPQVRRKIVFVAIVVFLLIAVGIIPVVIQANFSQSSSGAGDVFVPATATPTKTSTPLPVPDFQAFVRSSEEEPIARPVQRNCTYSTAYWLEHLEAWPALISVGDFSYTKEQAFTYIQKDTQSHWGNLFLQLHTTLLNLLSGSDPGDIKLTIADAISWMSNYVDNDSVTDLDNQIGQVLAQQLLDYNKGVIGPGMCEGDHELSGEGQITAAFSQLNEGSGTATLATSQTATLTSTTTRVVTLPKNTPTPTKSPKEDEGPPPLPTKPPSATDTQPPPPTAKPTDPPPPTAKPTDPPPPTERPTPTSPPT